MIKKTLKSLIQEEVVKFLNEAEHSDDEMVSKDNIDLQHEYDKLNQLLFEGKLPRIPLKWDNRKTMGGHVAGLYYKHTGQIVVKHLSISVFRKLTYRQFKNVLAHEMIHVKQMTLMNSKGGHGFEFHNEMRRINGMGLGFQVTEKVEEEMPVSDEILATRSARSFIAIVFNLDGKYSIAVTTPNVYNSDFGDIVRIFQHIVNYTGKYRNVEITVIESRNIKLINYPITRSFKRRVSHSDLSDEIFEELLNDKIIREVKIKRGVPAEISEDMEQLTNSGEAEYFEIS